MMSVHQFSAQPDGSRYIGIAILTVTDDAAPIQRDAHGYILVQWAWTRIR
jgi:hypothetical protein